MTDKNYTHIVAVVDDSGSMRGVAEEMNNALNVYFKDQGEVEGTCLVDYYQFGSTVSRLYDDRDVSEAEAGIRGASGLTALLDAIGQAMTEAGRKFANMSESRRPGSVQVVIVTDGHENHSKEWTAAKVKELIKEQTEKYNWDVVFLGANIDAVKVGAEYGINPDKAIDFNINSPVAVAATSASLSNYTRSYRAGGMSAASFSDEDREKAMAGS